MKKTCILALCTLFASLTNIQATENQVSEVGIPEIWTAKQAVIFALSGNPDNSIARKRIEQAQASATMAKSADYPLINVSAEYGQTNNPMYSFGNILNQGAFDNSIDFNDPGKTDNLQLKATIEYRLYNGGRDQANQEGADANINITESNLVAVHQQLGFEVVKTFQAIIQAEKMVLVREEALESITASLDVGRARYEAGDLLKQDLLNLELQQSIAKENLILSEHTFELTKRSFLNLLGLKDGEVMVSAEDVSGQELPGTISYHNRHELKRLEAYILAATSELEKAQGGHLPTVDAFASYQVDNGWEYDETGDSWMAGVRMDYNLFDGQRTSSQITIAQMQLQELSGQMNKLELALNLELQQAQLNYEQTKQRLAVTQKMVGVAEEVARLSRARFKEGVILASDLIDFEMRLSDARARHLAANAGYQVAIANLRRATGLQQFSLQ